MTKTRFSLMITIVAATLLLAACAPAMLTASLIPARSEAQPAVENNQTPSNSVQQADGNLRTLAVSGVGTLNLAPDVAYINIGVHTDNKEISAAIDANNANIKQVKDALLKLGVAEKDIQTQNFSVYTNQQYDNSGNATGTTYAVDNTLSVTVRDLTKLSSLLGEVTRSGANNIYGIQFGLADRSKAISDARRLALDDANKQAAEMAADMKVSLGAVQKAEVIIGSVNTPMYDTRNVKESLVNNSNVPIATGQISVTVNVNLVVEIK